MIDLPWLDPQQAERFPPPAQALAQPDGLLAAGGDLSPRRLLAAYRQGIFPWFSEGQPILWWSPSVRAVFDTARPHLSRRLARWLRGCDWELRVDSAFDEVIAACASSGERARGTWITPDMVAAYRRLHRLGHAHSFEAWDGDALVGGLYGLAAGRLFCGESMFSARGNGSKVALLGACRWLHRHGFPLLDAQLESAHLRTLGARVTTRDTFLARVRQLVDLAGIEGRWNMPDGPLYARDLVRPDGAAGPQ